jgi:hypothetical protein
MMMWGLSTRHGLLQMRTEETACACRGFLRILKNKPNINGPPGGTVYSGAIKLFTVKETSMLRNFTKRRETWAYFFWNDSLRKRKWIRGLGFHVSGIKVTVNRNKRINKVKSSSPASQLRQRWHRTDRELGLYIFLRES